MTKEISASILDLYLTGRTNSRLDGNFSLHLKETDSTIVIPSEVCVLPSTVPGASLGVFAMTTILPGTDIGPYPGPIVSALDMVRSDHVWEVCSPDGSVVGYIDGGGSHSNWLTHVQCARCEREQNLEVVQLGTRIYYRAMKEICYGDELLVWYGKGYVLYMGLPIYHQVRHRRVVSTVLRKSEGIKEAQQPYRPEHAFHRTMAMHSRWRCVLCNRGFNSRSNLRSHMRTHTMERPFSCRFCGRKFSQSSTLRNHVRLHTGEKPYRCEACNSCYSQLAGLRAHQRSATHKIPSK